MDEPFTTSTIKAKQQMDELAALAPRFTGQPPAGAAPPGQGGGAPGAGSPSVPGVPGGAPPGSTGPQMGPGAPAGGPQVPPGAMPQGQPDPALRMRMLEMKNPLAALTARYLGGQHAQQ